MYKSDVIQRGLMDPSCALGAAAAAARPTAAPEGHCQPWGRPGGDPGWIGGGGRLEGGYKGEHPGQERPARAKAQWL